MRLPCYTCESGYFLPRIDIAYSEYGNINSKKVILFFGGFSTSLKIHEWWSEGISEFNLDDCRLISINSLGSIYGTTGPISINPETQLPYGETFPDISISDQVNIYKKLLNAMNIKKVYKIIGCSLGAMQTLDFYNRYSDFAQKFVAIAGIRPSKMTRIYNSVQIRMINDSISSNLKRSDIINQMKNARMISRLLCTNEMALNEYSQTNQAHTIEESFNLESEEFGDLFCPHSYIRLTHAVNEFYICPESFPKLDCLNRSNSCSGKLYLIGISGDTYTLSHDIKKLSTFLRKQNKEVEYEEFETIKGHESWITDISNFKNILRRYVS